MKIKIGEKEYDVKVAESDEEKEKGLQNVANLPENEGMLFVWDNPDEVSIWMKDTITPLDIVFIDEDLDIISIKQGVPETEDLHTEQNVKYVLEVNVNSGIKVEDDVEFLTDKKLQLKRSKMSVLDENGNVQMDIEGGERIFSRKDTRKLIKFAKAAYATKQDKDYKALGKRVFKFLKIQDSNKPEYTSKE